MVEVVLITGHLGSGKTALADSLSERHGFHLVRSSKAVRDKYNLMSAEDMARLDMQAAGANWDQETDGAWLFDLVSKVAPAHGKIVVDHVRNERQLKHFREKPDWRIVHVHLYGPKKFLESKYEQKLEQEKLTYEQADPVESEEDIRHFRDDADVRINVDRSDHEDTYIRVAARLGLFPEPDGKFVDVLIGGQFGGGRADAAACPCDEKSFAQRFVSG